LEPRILLEDPARFYHDEHWVTDDDIFDNRLIVGDNLLVLKALKAEFQGRSSVCLSTHHHTIRRSSQARRPKLTNHQLIIPKEFINF
jgi:hypothetical protein